MASSFSELRESWFFRILQLQIEIDNYLLFLYPCCYSKQGSEGLYLVSEFACIVTLSYGVIYKW